MRASFVVTLILMSSLFMTLDSLAVDLAKRHDESYPGHRAFSDKSRNREYNPYGYTEVGIQQRGDFCSEDKRSPCTYSFMVKSDGSVTYQRIYPPSIEHHGHMNTRHLTRLWELIDESNFLFMEYSYTYGIDHCSTTYTMVIKDGYEKIIRNFCDSGPATLWAIENAIDDLREHVIWIDPNFTPEVEISCSRDGNNFLELTESSIKAGFVKEGEADNLQHSFEPQERGSPMDRHYWTWGPKIDPPDPERITQYRYTMMMMKMDSKGWYSGWYSDHYGDLLASPFAFTCRGTSSESQEFNKPWLREPSQINQ